ncbi:MAG TPA: hypothetical protein VF316_14230, partial [Polyangiaceae bacterium]
YCTGAPLAFKKYACSDGSAFAETLKLGNDAAPCTAPLKLVACDKAEGNDDAPGEMASAGCSRARGSTRQSFYCCPTLP